MKGLPWLVVSEVRAEAYGNFETMGVVVEVPAGQKPQQIAEVRAHLRESKGRRRVQNLVQVGNLPLYATSLFFLQPDTEYEDLCTRYMGLSDECFSTCVDA